MFHRCLDVMVVGFTIVYVAHASEPFHGNPMSIPGKVEAEHYDKGEPGVAYHDIDEKNLGADYREKTQVDIEKRPDASNGHGIGWTRKGEWLNYTVDVKQAGEYNLEIPVASNKKGGTFHLEVDGKDISGPIDVPDTGSWQKLEMIYHRGVHLKSGLQVMKVVMDAQGPSGSIADIDYIKFVSTEAPATPDNRLSQAEQADGWKLLFNGKNHDGWKCNNGKSIATPIENSSLVPYKSGGYIIIHEDQYGDFILKCDVKWEASHCNSGIFCRVSDPRNPVHTGFEVQVMSGKGTSKHDFGAIYDLSGTNVNMGRPTGEWNHVEIKCQGAHISVQVNGEKVSHINCDDYDQPGLCPDGKRHKFKLDRKPRAVKDFARSGYVGFQDHGQKVWYKNVKLLPLNNGK